MSTHRSSSCMYRARSDVCLAGGGVGLAAGGGVGRVIGGGVGLLTGGGGVACCGGGATGEGWRQDCGDGWEGGGVGERVIPAVERCDSTEGW